jgi:hypothetical protein
LVPEGHTRAALQRQNPVARFRLGAWIVGAFQKVGGWKLEFPGARCFTKTPVAIGPLQPSRIYPRNPRMCLIYGHSAAAALSERVSGHKSALSNRPFGTSIGLLRAGDANKSDNIRE